jgi:hypothetical protein
MPHCVTGVVRLGALEVVGDYRLCLFAQASFLFLPDSRKDKESVQCSWSIAERYVASVCSLPSAGLVNHVACTIRQQSITLRLRPRWSITWSVIAWLFCWQHAA